MAMERWIKHRVRICHSLVFRLIKSEGSTPRFGLLSSAQSLITYQARTSMDPAAYKRDNTRGPFLAAC